jgi:hypothetical protein
MSGQTRDPRTKRQQLERPAGLPGPLNPEEHYCVEPGEGEGGAEYFPKPGQSMLDGLLHAIARAAWLSMGHPPQRILVTRPEGGRLPACQDQVIRRYRGGQEIWSASTAVTPAPAAEAEPAPKPAARLAAIRPDAPTSRSVREPAAAGPGDAAVSVVLNLLGVS